MYEFEILPFFGAISAVLSLWAYLPYVRDTLARRTHPQRAAWLIWSALATISFLSQAYEGATASLWFAGAQTLGTLVIFSLSIRLGVGGFLSKRDCKLVALAALGVIAWYVTDTAAYALAITISVSLLGGGVIVLKAYHTPQSETLATWSLCFVASIFALLSVGRLDWLLMAYPAYLLVLNGAIVTAIILGRSRRPAVMAVTELAET